MRIILLALMVGFLPLATQAGDMSVAAAVEQAFQHARRGTRRAGPMKPEPEPSGNGLSHDEMLGRMGHVVETLIAMGEKRLSNPN